MSFEHLTLQPQWLDALAALGFEQATPVQRRVIPAHIAGSDGIALAPTGSGKTLAYGLSLLQPLHHVPLQGRSVYALVLVPTRELAQQVSHVLVDLIKSVRAQADTPLRVVTAVGGASINTQLMGLRGGASVLVATPGRLLELIDKDGLDLSGLRYAVLDEADRLLDSGFEDELKAIQQALHTTCRTWPHTWLFSATWNTGIDALASGWLREPLRIEETAGLVPTPPITQRAIAVDERRRAALLLQLIKTQEWKQVLVFVATQYAAEHVADKLYNNFKGTKIYATAFHGGLTLSQRTQRLQEFKDGKWDVLITTDLAARGIDIAGLPVVVNYDLPRSATDYTHRIGRTGRAGVAGLAISFVPPAARKHFDLIRQRNALALDVEVLPGFETTDLADAPVADANNNTGGLDPAGGVKGKRMSKKDKLRAANNATNNAVNGATSVSQAASPDTTNDASH
jgi:ATP-dependent RNA helicase RhlE